jgi:hypothetical protein
MKFGPREHLSGVFFSNFENAKFFVCGDKAEPCLTRPESDDYTLSCDDGVCASLEESIRSAANPPANTVYLSVELVGRRSLGKARPRFLGDPGRVVRVEQIERIQPFQPN